MASIGASCATSSSPNGSGNTSGNGGGGLGSSGAGLFIGPSGDASLGGGTEVTTGTCVSTTVCTSGCTDVPSAPIIDAATPSDAASHFSGTPSSSGGPCILEPGDGALLPNNWARPRFRWNPGASQTLFEVRVQAPGQNDLVAYTSSSSWTMPADVWKGLGAHSWGEDITVQVTGVGASDGTAAASTMKFQIAPANANGSLIYWAAVGDRTGDSWLEGFTVGDESVTPVLTVPQVQERMSRDVGGNLVTQAQGGSAPLANGPGSVQCIGCHAAVPDHNSVSFLDFYPWPGVAAAVDPSDTGKVPSWLTPGGAEALALPWLGMMTFSPSVWDSGSHYVVAGWQVGSTDVPWSGGGTGAPSNLVWIDLSTTQPLTFAGDAGLYTNLMGQNSAFVTNNKGKSYDYIERTGDPRGASCPSWSHDGTSIAYVSNNAAKDGRLQQGEADIYTVPYNGGKGGQATALTGASDPSAAEYYPWYSPDDQFIAYDRAPGNETLYYNPHSEVYVVPAHGGTATRLAANDSPACANAPSPGVTNSWPKWAPQAELCGGKTYYWLIFSSSRQGLAFNPKNMQMGNTETTSQLYLTALVVDAAGTTTTYPGVYIWNQPTTSLAFPGSNQSNHTPLWDVVSIPKSPPPR